ncbi:hypothetical protein ACIRCZ_18705 [Leifsonia sp. NPDC102414]|uniref:hypothetical protein n=1 Tax=Leifsonia sp. NPDC102414 TaxID=3364124 RepID=UPI00380F96AC
MTNLSAFDAVESRSMGRGEAGGSMIEDFPTAASSRWTVRALSDLRMQHPVADEAIDDAAEKAALLIPPAITPSGVVLAGERQLKIAMALGWSHLGVREFAEADDPAVIAQIAMDRALESGSLPTLLDELAYVEEVVRPAFEARREVSRQQNAANARSAKAQCTLGKSNASVEVADSASSTLARAQTVSEKSMPLELAESATSTVGAGSWRDVVAANLVGASRDQIEKMQKMQRLAADPDLSEVGRRRIQKEIEAANTDRKVTPHLLAAQKIHLADTASEEDRQAALRFRTLREFDDAVSALDRFIAQHGAAEFAELVRSSALDVEAFEDAQVPAAYRALAWVDEVAELVRAMKRAATA